MIKPKIESKNVNIEDIINEYRVIYKKYTKIINTLTQNDITKTSEISQDDLIRINDQLCEEHHDFSSSYPVVVRYIINGKYYPRSFKLWLNSLTGTQWKNEEEFLKSQSRFCEFVYREEFPRDDPKNAIKLGEEVYEDLINENNAFKKSVEEFREKEKLLTEKLSRERREKLQKYVMDLTTK